MTSYTPVQIHAPGGPLTAPGNDHRRGLHTAAGPGACQGRVLHVTHPLPSYQQSWSTSSPCQPHAAVSNRPSRVHHIPYTLVALHRHLPNTFKRTSITSNAWPARLPGPPVFEACALGIYVLESRTWNLEPRT